MAAYSYIRFSSVEQSKGDSLRRQEAKIAARAADLGLTLDTSLSMRDLGISAFDKSNVSKGALGAFLKAVEVGKVPIGSYLIVESLDRLSRANITDALQQFLALLNAGIIIVTVLDNQVYSKQSVGENFSQLIISICAMQRANEESETKSKRIVASWDKKLQDVIDHKKLLTKRVPYWMQVIDDKIELIPDRVDVVRRIYQLSKSGNGTHTIVKVLNADTPFWQHAKQWDVQYVNKILTSHAIYGAIEVKGQIVEDYFPAVLSKDEWNYVQNRRTSRRATTKGGNRKGKNLSNLFSGLTYCGYCKSPMWMNSYNGLTGAGRVRTASLICYGARTGSTNCSCIRWDYSEIEQGFLTKVAQLDLHTLFGAADTHKVTQLEKEMMEVSSRIEHNKKRTNNLYVAIEEDPLPGLTSRIKKLETEIAKDEKLKVKLLQDISSEKTATNSMKERRAVLLQFLKLQRNTTDADTLRRIRESLHEQIKSLVERIDLYPTGPMLNRAEKEMRFFNVLLRSGTTVHIANS